MMWIHFAHMHWQCTSVPGYIMEVKYVKHKGFTVWRVKDHHGDTLDKGRTVQPIDAMKLALTATKQIEILKAEIKKMDLPIPSNSTESNVTC